jgi:hypothetical protein
MFLTLLQFFSFKEATDVILCASHYFPNHSLERPRPDHLPRTTFPHLRNLQVIWLNRGDKYNYDQCPWFFGYFDFASASGHCSISFRVGALHSTIQLPEVKKFTCTSFHDLQNVSLPSSLQHLSLGSPCNISLRRKDFKLPRSLASFDKVKTLEVEIWLICQNKNIPSLAKHFSNVTRIIVKPNTAETNFYDRAEPYRMSVEDPGFWHHLEAGEPFFPMLQTIEVAGCDRQLKRAYWTAEIIKSVIAIRNQIGWPVENLRFDTPCPFYIDWFRANVENVGVFEFEDEFAWSLGSWKEN